MPQSDEYRPVQPVVPLLPEARGFMRNYTQPRMGNETLHAEQRRLLAKRLELWEQGRHLKGAKLPHLTTQIKVQIVADDSAIRSDEVSRFVAAGLRVDKKRKTVGFCQAFD